MFVSLKEHFEGIRNEFVKAASVQSLLAGELTQEEYRSVLRQVYHHTRENPQLQALATVYFRGRQRDLVRAFFSHAASEIGHDQLALNDFVTLGGDPSTIPYENPLPETSALLAYGFYQIYNLNPLGYLGYLFFLEFNGTGSGPLFRDALTKIGVPQNAMTFLQDHMEIDVGHNKLMERYVADLSLSRADIDAIKYSMAVTGRLYAHMLDAAVRDAREGVQTGWNWEELNADGLTPERIPADGAGVRRDGARLSAAKVA